MRRNTLSLELATRTEALVCTETVLFAVTNVVAILGNLLTFYAVYRNHRLRTIPNMFLIALALSDILMSTICMPFKRSAAFKHLISLRLGRVVLELWQQLQSADISVLLTGKSIPRSLRSKDPWSIHFHCLVLGSGWICSHITLQKWQRWVPAWKSNVSVQSWK